MDNAATAEAKTRAKYTRLIFVRTILREQRGSILPKNYEQAKNS